MNVRTVLEVLRQGHPLLLLRGLRLMTPYYRLVWLVSATRCGLLPRLRAGAVAFSDLADEMVREPGDHDWLRAWLELGVRVGELRCTGGRYSLGGFLARQMVRTKHDAFVAFLEEVTTLHHRLIVETPQRLARGQRFALSDQDGILIARSSRLVSPFVQEAIDEVVPRRGAMRLLDVGAGSGTYMRYAVERNPDLTAVGLELQPEVAEFANAKLREWGIADRAHVDRRDVREQPCGEAFDLVTFHNNIYYFPLAERVPLLRHALALLKPGGTLLLTTACGGGSPTVAALDIWSAGTEGCGRLPTPEELLAQLGEAGFIAARGRRLVPGDSFHAFLASKPAGRP